MVPELRVEGVRFRVYRGASLRAFGEAGSASLRRDSTELSARALDATLPLQGAQPVEISAPEGDGVLAERVFSLGGGITVRRGPDVARTARARFVPDGRGAAGIVSGDDPVVIEGSGYRLQGTGFTLDPGKGEILMQGGAKLVAGSEEGR